MDEKLPGSLLRFAMRSARRHQIYLAALSILVFLLAAAPLEFQRRLINDLAGERDFANVVTLTLAYLGVVVLEGLCKLAMNVYRSWISETSTLALRDLTASAFHGGESDLSAADRGREISIAVAEVEPVGGFTGEILSEPLLQAGILVSVLAYMLYINPLMALMCIGIYGPQIAITLLSQLRINALVAERIAELRTYSFDIVDHAVSKLDHVADMRRIVVSVFRLNMRASVVKYAAHFLANAIQHAGIAAALCLGGWLVIEGRTEVGTIVAFVAGFAKIDQPWRDLIAWYRSYSVAEQKYRLIVLGVERGDAASR